MIWEFKHAKQAVSSGVYITLYNTERELECTRYSYVTSGVYITLYNKEKELECTRYSTCFKWSVHNPVQ